MLNRRGGIECDFTVTRLDEDRFGIVTGTAFGNHDLAWIRSHLPGRRLGRRARRRTSRRSGRASRCGGRARATCSRGCTTADLSNEAFPYMTCRDIDVGDVPVRALRVTYVGELGWELYCPTEFGAALWRTLWDAGDGARARRRRLPRDRLAAAGEGLPRLGRRHHARRAPVPGRPRLRGQARPRASSSAARRCCARATTARAPRLCCLVLDDPRSVALSNEPVRVDGQVLGRVTSGGYGYTVGASIAYAYLPRRARRAPGTEVAVEIFGEWVGGPRRARAALRPGGRAGAGLALAGVARLDLLDGPAVAVGVAEEHERAPRHVVDVGDVDAAL